MNSNWRETKVTCLAASLALLCGLAGANEPAEDESLSVWGFRAGDAVPLENRTTEDADKVMRIATYPAKAGFDRVFVRYTDKRGVCSVAGHIDVDDGVPYESVVGKLMDLVAERLGRPKPTLTLPNSQFHVWLRDDAEPFDSVAVVGDVDSVFVGFFFKNDVACQAEQEAANEAAVEAALAPITLQ